MMKVPFGMALRQTTGFVESLLYLIGLDWEVPAFNTPGRRRKTHAASIPHRGAQGPLYLLIDSTGIKVEGEGVWTEEGQQTVPGLFARRRRKRGGPWRRVWRKFRGRCNFWRLCQEQPPARSTDNP
jgi:hypothetical protein